MTGYGAVAPYASSLASTKSTAVPRVIGRVDAAGNVDTSTALNDAVDGNNPRSVTSVDGSNFYIAGGKGGVNYATLGANKSIGITDGSSKTVPDNFRQLGIVDGQLYASSSTIVNNVAYKGISTIGSGLPTSGNQPVTLLSTDQATDDSYGFFFADLDGNPGVDTLYIADATKGLEKFTLQGNAWKAADTASGKYIGLTGVKQGNAVTLFLTTANQLLKLTDTSGNGNLSVTATVLVTAKSSTALRGVALAPNN